MPRTQIDRTERWATCCNDCAARNASLARVDHERLIELRSSVSIFSGSQDQIGESCGLNSTMRVSTRPMWYATWKISSTGAVVDVRFYFDPDTDQPHIYNHGVTEAEVEEVLRRSGEDLPARDNSRMKVGQTAAGRYLQVVYVPDDDPNSVFVITAYELRGKAKQAFRRRRRKRRGK